MREGENIKLHATRQPIYAHHGYVETQKETVKEVAVVNVIDYFTAVVQIKSNKKMARLSLKPDANGIIYGTLMNKTSKYEVYYLQ